MHSSRTDSFGISLRNLERENIFGQIHKLFGDLSFSLDGFPRNMISCDRGIPRGDECTESRTRERSSFLEARSEVVSRTSRASLLARSAITLRLNDVDFNPLHLTMIRRDQLAGTLFLAILFRTTRLTVACSRQEREREREMRIFSLFPFVISLRLRDTVDSAPRTPSNVK